MNRHEGRYVGNLLCQIEEDVEEPRIRPIQHAEAIRTRFYLQVRVDGSIYDWKFAKKHRSPNARRKANGVILCWRIEKLTLIVQRAVLEDERNLVIARRQIEDALLRIAEQIEPGHAGVHVQAGDA